jgi:hypothetical protein
MTKFQKRLHKLSRNNAHALVLGSAFGILDQVVEIYDTVFVISAVPPSVRAKNLVYKETFVKLDHIQNIASIFIDHNELHNLDKVEALWKTHNSIIFVEGGERIDNNIAKPLYDSGWACTSLQGIFHVWEHYR